jgi:hypothetical protein
MAHSAEVIGMAAFSLVGAILEELDKQHPGSKARILADVRSETSANAAAHPTGNSPAILEILNAF